MSEFFLHSFNTLSHGLIGYIVPFLFVLTIVVFFHELGHFLVARWAGVKVLTFSLGFGPELVGFNDRHGTRWKISADSARRLRQVFRRRERGLDAVDRSARQHDRGRARRQFPPQEGRPARRDRRRRSDRQFHSGDRDLHRPVRVYSASRASIRARRQDRGRQRCRGRRLPGRRRRDRDRRQPIESFADMQRIVARQRRSSSLRSRSSAAIRHRRS